MIIYEKSKSPENNSENFIEKEISSSILECRRLSKEINLEK